MFLSASGIIAIIASIIMAAVPPQQQASPTINDLVDRGINAVTAPAGTANTADVLPAFNLEDSLANLQGYTSQAKAAESNGYQVYFSYGNAWVGGNGKGFIRCLWLEDASLTDINGNAWNSNSYADVSADMKATCANAGDPSMKFTGYGDVIPATTFLGERGALILHTLYPCSTVIERGAMVGIGDEARAHVKEICNL